MSPSLSSRFTPLLILTFAGAFACSDNESTPSKDAGVVDSGTNNDNDAGNTENDAGNTENDAGRSRITMFAGSSGSSGNLDGPRQQARFGGPSAIARAQDGTIYIADTSNYTIRKISPAGEISTLAGRSGEDGNADGVGDAARFELPTALVIDAEGNLIVSDSYAGTLRKVTSEGAVSTWAGRAGELSNTDGDLSTARFRAPEGLAFDGAGNLYVADREAHTIRKITPAGEVSTYAGKDQMFGDTDGARTDALLNGPFGVAAKADGTLAVADSGNNTIRVITSSVVSTLAGTPGAPQDTTDGTGPEARFGRPRALVFDATGALIVADTFNDRLRHITPAGVVTTWAGSFAGSKDGARNEATFSFSSGLFLADEGGKAILYVVDTGSSIIRRIEDDVVTTFAGAAVELDLVDGPALDARFFAPTSAMLREDGSLVVADTYNHALRAIAADGTVSTLGGDPNDPSVADGPLANARFNQPRYLLDDGEGGYFVADTGNYLIRHVGADGEVSTYAGGPISRGNTHVDGPLLEARFAGPGSMAKDSAGNIYVVDTGNFAIRKIGVDGMVSTVAGDGRPGFLDGIGTQTRFNAPDNVIVVDDQTLLVADTHNHALRKIELRESGNVVSTFAGAAADEHEEGTMGSVDAIGLAARFGGPRGMLREGNSVLVADSFTSLIRSVDLTTGEVTTVAGTRGRYGVGERELPGVLFEPQTMLRMPDQSLLVIFMGGLQKIEGL